MALKSARCLWCVRAPHPPCSFPHWYRKGSLKPQRIMGNNESLLDVTRLILMAWDPGAVSRDSVTVWVHKSGKESITILFTLFKYCTFDMTLRRLYFPSVFRSDATFLLSLLYVSEGQFDLFIPWHPFNSYRFTILHLRNKKKKTLSKMRFSSLKYQTFL